MKLQLDFVDITDVQFGPKTEVKDRVLYINKEEARALVLEDEKIVDATIELAYPGTKTRIVNIQDVAQPRCKVSPEGADFPGWIAPPSQCAGSGVTRVLRGMAVVLCNSDSDRQFHSFLDMDGHIGKISIFAKMPLVVLTAVKKNDAYNYTQFDTAIHRAQLKLAVYLAKAGVPLKADETKTYEFDLGSVPRDSKLPRVGYFFQMYTPQYDHLGLAEPIFYGTACLNTLPTVVNPLEVLDGSNVSYFPAKSLTTYFIQNHGMITELLERNNKDLLFCGMIVSYAHMDPVQRDRRAMISARLAKEVLYADGMVMTKVHGGMVHMDLATTCEAMERVGVKAIPMHQGLVNAGTLADNALFKSDLIPGVIYMGVTIERFPVRFKPEVFLGGTGETVLFSPDHVFMQAKDTDIVGEEFLVPGVHDHMGSRPIISYDY